MTSPSQLTHIAAREHLADLTRTAEQARLAAAVRNGQDEPGRDGLIAWIAGRLPRRAARSSRHAPAVAPPGPVEP